MLFCFSSFVVAGGSSLPVASRRLLHSRSHYSFLIIELNFPPFFQYTFQYVKKLTGLEMRQVSHTLLERAMVVICKIA